MFRSLIAVTLSVAVFALAGCGNGSSGTAAGPAVPATFFVDQPIAEVPQAIPDLKQSAKEGDSVVIHAVIGGSRQPFVEGRAMMSVVDATLPKSCGINAIEEHCDTPWDYCCSTREQLLPAVATVQFVGDDGAVLRASLKDTPQIRPFSTLAIRGKVGPRVDDQSLTVIVEAVYVQTR